MKKSDFLLLYLLALLVLSITFIYQSDPGYMDSEFYYLGSRQILSGKLTIPVIWNYLDNPNSLPNPTFSYWMPFASLVSAISMGIFGVSFLGSRILLLLFAAGLAPLAYWLSFKITSNHFTSIIAGLLAIFSGYYLKFLTIPETILPYMILGSLYFFQFGKLFDRKKEKEIRSREIIFFGLITGFLHLSRVDGIIFFILGIILIFYLCFTNFKFDRIKAIRDISIFIGTYCLVMSFWLVSNLEFYQSIFSPASSKAMWIATYDDTFIYPASELTLDYWLENSILLRPSQIFEALKLNVSNLLAVQTLVFGFPLFILGIVKNFRNSTLRIGIIYYGLIFLLMTIIFPLAGSRGGFLHSASATQILIWVMIADGLQGFFKWGIQKRNWQLKRSQKMFGSAFIVLIFLFSFIVYRSDVVGDSLHELKWGRDYSTYQSVEAIISQISTDKKEVIMINNPLGYYYSTDRWGIVIPNSESDQFLEVINQFNVKFIVLDNNLPNKFKENHFSLIEENFEIIQDLPSGIKIYEHKN